MHRRTGRGAGTSGLDCNPGMLAVARSITPPGRSIEWFETSAEAMPLPDEAFDVVLNMEVVEHVAALGLFVRR